MQSLKITTFLVILALLGDPVYSQEIDPGLFKRSQIISVETSKKQLKLYYLEENHTRTLHCQCHFDKLKQVYPAHCKPKRAATAKALKKEILEWVHLMPPAVFAGRLKCWSGTACGKVSPGGAQDPTCCRVMSPKFKRMEADMHNLFPAIAFTGDNPLTQKFGGMGEYRFCSKEPVTAPRKGARGDVARAYFYMSYQYKIPMPDDLENELRKWHLADPPNEWEEKRNTLIEIDQGNRNPFIDHPELVERVRNF